MSIEYFKQLTIRNAACSILDNLENNLTVESDTEGS